MMNIQYYYTNPDRGQVPKKKSSSFILMAIASVLVVILMIFLIGTLVSGWEVHGFIPQDVDISKDIDISKEPLQKQYEGENFIINSFDDRYTLTPVAIYEISAKVVSIRTYKDEMQVSPIDLCTVWGQMAGEPNISYSQSERFCSYYYRSVPYFGEYYMISHSSNNHIIPASGNVSSALNSMRVNDKVTLKGFLINVKNEKGNSWKTSLTRYDSGYGACEIIYVTEIRTENRIWK